MSEFEKEREYANGKKQDNSEEDNVIEQAALESDEQDTFGDEDDSNEERDVAEAAKASEQAAAPKPAMSPWPWVGLSVIAIGALAFVLLTGKTGGSGGEIAKMDGQSFTKADFYDQISKQVPNEQLVSMIDSLMEGKMIENIADEKGIKVTDADVQAEIENFKKNFGGDEGFQQALQQNGMTLADFKTQQVLPNLLKKKLYQSEHPAKDEDFKAYYDKNKETFATTPKQVRASHILVNTQEEADAILADLKSGKDFAAIAKEKSQDPGSKDNGGDLNFFGRGAMDPTFEEAAFSLKKGELSGVVQSQYGFHIIKVTDIKEAVVPPYEEKKADVEAGFWNDEMTNKSPEWLVELKKENHYENLAASNEPAASEPAASEPAASEPAASAPAESAPAAK